MSDSTKVRYLEGHKGPTVEIPTPEGVPLRFTVASGGDRAGAFLLDAFLIIMAFIVCGIVITALMVIDSATASSLAFVLIFGFRNFYFSGLEILWRGRTVGKRMIGLQVIDRSGKPLRVEAIFARNLTREIEVFLPLTILLAGDELIPNLPPWGRLISLLWVMGFIFFPLFNKQRLRVGDLVAGTMVVQAPRRTLLPDLVEEPAEEVASGEMARFAFTREQLDSYGIYELQVLEKILREPKTPAETLLAVSERIAKKIGYTGEMYPSLEFLSEFYRAQRAYLEGRMLMGDKRADKSVAPQAGKPRALQTKLSGKERSRAKPSASAEPLQWRTPEDPPQAASQAGDPAGPRVPPVPVVPPAPPTPPADEV